MSDREKLERLAALDKVSRVRFAVVAGETIVHTLKDRPDLLLAMVDGGETLFLRRAKEIYANHKFERSDLRLIFNRLQREVAKMRANGEDVSIHG